MATAADPGSRSSQAACSGDLLTPYVPRLVIDWLREAPGQRHREVGGTMAFVDISGFTALSERLARRGKVGAELMRDSLDAVFTALLDEAYDYGAGLLKWGGDALLLLFDGPEHEARACRAAWEMQRTLEVVGRVRTGGGRPIALRMSVGIATGAFQFFLLGSVHRELLVAGPDVTRTVAIEAIADAGEICVGGELAARLDPACTGAVKDGLAHLLVAPPTVAGRRAPDVGEVSTLDLAACIPVAAREHVLLERTEPEHRTVTAAFIDLMDTDAILARHGIDGLAEGLEERIDAIQETALAYGVPFYESDVGRGSVKALLTAGAPSSTGHDEERMLRALREVMDRPGLVPVRVGVNTGKVFTGDFGPPYRRSYRVFGDAVNTAARVMAKAAPGQLLSTDSVLERSRTLFATTPIAPFAAKGKAEPVRASAVGPIAGTRAGHRAATALLGRDRELQALLALVDDARHGHGWVAEISGAAGLGKSRLVEELVECAPDVLVLRARCEVYEAATPYFALREPLRAVLGVTGEADSPEVERALRDAVHATDPGLAPWIPLLGILLGLDLPPTPESEALDDGFLRDRLAEVALRFLALRLAAAPTMLVVEDAQFMDEASRDILLRLARSGRDMHQVLLLTHTAVDGTWAAGEDDVRVAALTLLPLPARSALELVERLTDDAPLRRHEAEELVRRAGGNPLFVAELVEAARRTGSVDALPDSVESLVSGQIDRLPATDRTVLRYAAVLGAAFDPRQLAEAVGGEAQLDDGVWTRLASFVDREPGGALRFRNRLVRDAAYEGLSYRRRRALHARVGAAIEATAGSSVEEELGTLALHFHEAQRWEKAWHYCRRAGERAAAVSANVEAAAFYERALAAVAHLRSVPVDERVAAWTGLATACIGAGAFERAYEALRRASGLLVGQPVAQARIRQRRAVARVQTADFPGAIRETSAGLRLVAGRDDPEAVRARASLSSLRADVKLQQGRVREALALAEVAAREAEAAGEPEALARAYSVLDGAYQMLGQPHRAVHEVKALAIWEELGLVRRAALVRMNLGVQAYADGRWTEAVEHYQASRDGFLQSGDRSHAAFAAANLGEVLVSRRRLEEAAVTLREARRDLRAAHLAVGAIFAEIQLGRLLRLEHDLAGALELLASVVAEAQALGHPGLHVEASVQLATAQVEAGAPVEALTTLERTERLAGGAAAMSEASLRRVRARALAALGDDDATASELERGLRSARDQGLLYEQLLALRARARLAERTGRTPDAGELQEVERLLQLLGLTSAAERDGQPPTQRTPSTSV